MQVLLVLSDSSARSAASAPEAAARRGVCRRRRRQQAGRQAPPAPIDQNSASLPSALTHFRGALEVASALAAQGQQEVDVGVGVVLI